MYLKNTENRKKDNGIIESLIEKAALVVPSGIAHGPLMPILRSMALPMLKYYFVQSDRTYKKKCSLWLLKMMNRWKNSLS